MCAKNNITRKTIIFYSISIAIIVALIIFIANYKFVTVQGISMMPTYSDGQILLIKRGDSDIAIGDTIVFKANNEYSIKRVLARENDNVKISGGLLYVNEVKIQTFLCDNSSKEYYLQSNQYFVVGDNQSKSYDSRDYGPINSNQILGKVVLAFW